MRSRRSVIRPWGKSAEPKNRFNAKIYVDYGVNYDKVKLTQFSQMIQKFVWYVRSFTLLMRNIFNFFFFLISDYFNE